MKFLVKAQLLDNDGIVQTRFFDLEEDDEGYAKERAQQNMILEFESEFMPEGYIASRLQYQVFVPYNHDLFVNTAAYNTRRKQAIEASERIRAALDY